MDVQTQELIEHLVRIHGEQGLSPRREDWQALLSLPADSPVDMLNLLRFKAEVQTPAGVKTGFAAYGDYSKGVAGAFARVGGQLLYFGKMNWTFGTSDGGPWDAAILTRYPAPRALADFWLDRASLGGRAPAEGRLARRIPHTRSKQAISHPWDHR